MLEAYWLFGEPNTDLARSPVRINEYISLFKHACVFQRKLHLSDLMVIGAPNFRRAYQLDPEFKKLVDSDIVDISLLHAEDDGRGAPLDLVGVMNLHLLADLFYPEEREFYSGEGGREFLKRLQAKGPPNLIVRNGNERDPRFTAHVLNALGGDYLKQGLGSDHALFETCTHELHSELAATGTPLGAIWFEEGRNEDGTYRWKIPTVLDRMYQSVDHHLSSERRKEIRDTVWRFYRAHLFRAESDLMEVDPVVPPDTDFYIEVMYGKRADLFFAPTQDDKYHVYRIATDLDDETLYRHLDFKTILEVRELGATYFGAASRLEAQPEISAEARLHRDEARAAHLGVALQEYKHRAVALLSERFPLLCQRRWERELILRVATVIDQAAVDSHGRPRPVVSALVTSAMGKIGSAVPFDTLLALNMEARPLARYLMNFATPMLYISDGKVATAVESLANGMRRGALLGAQPRAKIDARLIADKSSGLKDSTTLYGPVQRSK